MQFLLETSPLRLRNWLSERGQPAYRATQIYHWVMQRRAGDFDAMTELPTSLRHQLTEGFSLFSSQVAVAHRADDGTEKLLIELYDGKHVECVLLRDGQRRTICVSSQVGCAMGCVFCASGLEGVERNLSSAEILEQALHLQALLPESERLTHVVMMGMGEPLANLDNVLAALERMHDPAGLGIGARRITISTVGLPAAIDRLCEYPRKYHLAVSLHAASNRLRNQLVPVNARIGVESILAAADRYFDVSGRRLTYEYVLLRGINDSERHARELASLLKGRAALLNVIPYNPVPSLPYQTPSPRAVERFRELLQEAGITVQFRQRKGDEINAACGQLRRVHR